MNSDLNQNPDDPGTRGVVYALLGLFSIVGFVAFIAWLAN